MRTSYRGLSRFVLLGTLVCGISACDVIQQQALRGYMALNPSIGSEPVALKNAPGVKAETVLEGLEFPWGLAQLPDGDLLLTEKPGRLNRVDISSGQRQVIGGVPDVYFRGQGGLLGVAVHPQFAQNQLVYLAYSVAAGDGLSTTRLYRARLEDDQLQDGSVLFTAAPALDGSNHYGGALLFGADGLLYLTVGDRQQRSNAQALDSDLGKIHRFDEDGRPRGHAGVAGRKPSLYSVGHRNPQGLALDSRGQLWSAEHGPQGGDEINRIRAGANYGWPVITYGEEYGGGKIGEGNAKPGLEQPVHYYLPSIATAGIGFYTGERLPQFRGNLFVAALRATHLNRLSFDDNGRPSETRLLEFLNMRIRHVLEGANGELFVLAENGVLLQLVPG